MKPRRPPFQFLSPFLVSFAMAACGGGGSSSQASAPAPSGPDAQAVSWLQQNAREFSSTDPADEDFSDLAAFGDAIGDARIVSLGEISHGAGTVFDLKTRLVKYLHQKKGFDVFMMESGMFDVSRVWQLAQTGQSVDDMAPGVIFFMYSKSAEGRKVLQYIDSRRSTASPLIFAGMDSNHTGARSRDELLPMLETYLGARGSVIPASGDWPAYKELVGQAIAMNTTPPEQAKLNSFYAASTALEGELCPAQTDSYAFPNSPGWWCRIVKSLRNEADRRWKGAANRDIDMAANAQWLIDHSYAGHKIIIWAHTVHVARDSFTAGATMGSELNRVYGSQMYVASFTASKGKAVNFGNMNTYDVAADSAGSVENILDKLGKAQLFVDTRRNPPPSTLSTLASKEYEYGYRSSTYLGSAYDGLFYSNTIQPVTINR